MRPFLLAFLAFSTCLPLSGCERPLARTSLADTPTVRPASPRFITSVSELQERLSKLRRLQQTRVAEVLSLDPERATFADAFGRVDDVFTQVNRLEWELLAILDNARDTLPPEIMEPAQAAQIEERNLLAEMFQNRQLFDVLKRVAERSERALGRDDVRLRDSLFRKFRDNGLELSPEKQTELRDTRARVSELATKWGEAAPGSRRRAVVEYTAEELEGVSPELLEPFRQPDGTFRVQFADAAVFDEIMVTARNPETRKKTFIGYRSSGNAENNDLLRELTLARMQVGHLLGYDSWANYITERYLARNAKGADDFLAGVRDGVKEKFEAERAELAALKRADGHSGPVEIWDTGYYLARLKKEKYNVDSSAVQEFFEVEPTVRRMLPLFEEILQIRIEEVHNVALPTPQSSAYYVTDSVTGKVLGYLYLDLFDRPSKQSYGTSYFMQPRVVRDGKLIQPAVSFVTTRISPSADGKPAFMTLSDLDVVFYELGHSFHCLFATSEWGMVNDYVEYPTEYSEVPSMMFGRLSSEPAVLARLGVHYQDPERKLPFDLIERMNAARKATIVHDDLAPYLATGRADMALNKITRPEELPADLRELVNPAYSDGYYEFPKEANFAAQFFHMTWDLCAAGYYGYQWSDAIGVDLLDHLKSAPGGVLDKGAWSRYRTEILEAGHTRDGTDSAAAFLGRPWSIEAYSKSYL